ncbi:MAG TPA: bifunctional nuclease domain-containing protein [Ktedonobacteraceae bacterium]
MQLRSDRELVLLARSGNKEAFGELVERYQPMARRIASGLMAQEDQVQEVIQEAFLAAYLSLDQLREPQRFKAWLYSIVLNVSRTFFKESKLNPLSLENLMGGIYRELLPLSDAFVDPQEVAEEQELHRLLLSAIQSLSQKERAATLLFYFEQLSLQEVAAILGISVTAVKSRLFKARSQLRRQLLSTAEQERLTLERTERKSAMVKVVIHAVRKNMLTDQRVVILRDEAGRHYLFIWIAQMEALTIALGLTGITPQRPLPAHFMANMLKATGVQLEEVRIEALKDEIFYAVAKVRNGELVREVDVRPSDALGLAVLMGCPIFAAEEVLEKHAIAVPEGKDAELFYTECSLKQHGITPPEGKTIPLRKRDEEQDRANVLKALEEFMNPVRTPPTAEEIEQAKQRYLASLLREDE